MPDPRLLNPLNGSDHDLAPFRGAARTYVVACLPRTGSTLLCRSLWSTGLAGAPMEYLASEQIRDWEVRLGSSALTRGRHRLLRGRAVPLAGRGFWSDARLRSYFERIRARRTGSNGWFGVNIAYFHLGAFFSRRGREPEDFLGPIRWIRLTRRDKLAQAISWARARQTGSWASRQPERRAPRFDRALITRHVRKIEQHEEGWSRWLEQRGIEPLQLAYEEVAADREDSVRRVLRWLTVPEADTCRVPEVPLRSQADELSRAWAERLRGPVDTRARPPEIPGPLD